MGVSLSTPRISLSFRVIFHKREAEQQLEEAEQKDLYLEECFDSVPNAKARSHATYQPNVISEHDYHRLVAYVEKVVPTLPKRLQTELPRVSIISLMPSADDGMPHTRPDSIICFPNMEQVFSITTLKHELWHIHQRLYPELWKTVFESLLWKPWKGVIPSRLEEYRRLNPDTIDSPNWVFHDTWVPIPVFKDISKPNVSQVDICFYHVVDMYHTKQVPPELAFYFSGLPPIAFEHPREITAYLLSEPDTYQHSNGFRDIITQLGHLSIS
jgi:hypothetical protein